MSSATAANLTAHLDRTYGMLRLALPTKAMADAALRSILSPKPARVAGAGADLDAVRDRLTGLALAQIGKQARREPGWRAGSDRRGLRSRRFALSVDADTPGSTVTGADADADAEHEQRDIEFAQRVLADITDFTLSTLIRSIDPRRRLVLVLGAVYGFDDATVAKVVDRRPDQIAGLRSEAYASLRHLLIPEARRLLRRAAMASKQRPPLLRPVTQVVGANGYVVFRDGKAFFQPMGSSPLLWWAKQLIHRFVEMLQRRHHHHPEDDDVGDPGRRSKAPRPTPTQVPFRRPKATPSMRGYKLPQPTRGTSRYGGQGSTPSTERLSSPRRPLSVGGSPHSSYTSARWK